ncbi:LLM class flavin-dependent oxidoreductase [Corynebacterium macclintockiae]|uniref:LLM class flavin-dependent oxidoreductase n=1 Tax=Corynebacterium macclintockiae TaxID=2913501 RepID=UPI003EB747F4
MLHQSIELAVEADRLGVNSAYFRVHHFAPQQAAPMPLLAAVAARTKNIEVGTGVIDIRYENPLHLGREAVPAHVQARFIHPGPPTLPQFGPPRLVGRGYTRNGQVGWPGGRQSHELHTPHREQRRQLRRPTSRAAPGLQGNLHQ